MQKYNYRQAYRLEWPRGMDIIELTDFGAQLEKWCCEYCQDKITLADSAIYVYNYDDAVLLRMTWLS